jgi:hypothetical protein
MIQQSHFGAYTWRNVLQDTIEMLTYVYCSLIHNNHAMLTAQMPYNWWMDQENVIYILYDTYNT